MIKSSMLLLAGLGCAGASPADQGSDVDALVAKLMAKNKVPAVSVLVLDHGQPLKQTTYGIADLELGVPATNKTLFQIGSVGKMFTAAGILRLERDGKLSLNDSLAKFFPDAPSYWKPIKLRNLLNQTSGIPDYYDGEIKIDPKKEMSEDELVKFTEVLKPAFEPGTKWAYSNSGYMLLGIIMHKVTGALYSDYLSQTIWTPAGMKTIRTVDDREVIPNRCKGYEMSPQGIVNQDWSSRSACSTADGTLYATTDDFIAWDRALSDKSVLNEKELEAFWAEGKLADGHPTSYSLGWALSSRLGCGAKWHNGEAQGFRSNYTRFDDGLSVVVLTNATFTNVDRLARDIAAIYRPQLHWQVLPEISNPDAAKAIALANAFLAGKAAGYAGQAEAVGPAIAAAMPGLQKRFGKISTIACLKMWETDQHKNYAFRVSFAKLQAFLQVTVAADGKITNVDFEPSS
ncbi:MAG: beta-lactamase family protein [Armatimonadetes bacterium]|nr:beta-lactamase family protein [Armatimonadota bacterium]